PPSWPANVPELQNTLRRAALWSPGNPLPPDDVRDALIQEPRVGGADVLARPLGPGFSLPAVLGEVARHYLERALAETDGNRSRAAQRLGLRSHQTLANWLPRPGVAANRSHQHRGSRSLTKRQSSSGARMTSRRGDSR